FQLFAELIESRLELFKQADHLRIAPNGSLCFDLTTSLGQLDFGRTQLLTEMIEMFDVAGEAKILPPGHPSVNADHLSLHIQKRTAAVAARDGRIGLNPNLIVGRLQKISHVAGQFRGGVNSADNAGGGGELETLR